MTERRLNEIRKITQLHALVDKCRECGAKAGKACSTPEGAGRAPHSDRTGRMYWRAMEAIIDLLHEVARLNEENARLRQGMAATAEQRGEGI